MYTSLSLLLFYHAAFIFCCQLHSIYLKRSAVFFFFGQLSLVSVDALPALYAGWGNFTESLSTPSHKWASVFCLQGKLITVSWITYNRISSTGANMYLPDFLTYITHFLLTPHTIYSIQSWVSVIDPGHSWCCLLLVSMCSQARFSGFSQWGFIHDFSVKYRSTTHWCGFTRWSQSTYVVFYGEKCVCCCTVSKG